MPKRLLLIGAFFPLDETFIVSKLHLKIMASISASNFN